MKLSNSGLVTALRSSAPGMIMALVLTACATTGGGVAEDPIPQRAQARWDALLAGDFETAYGYLTPGYRSSKTLTDYEMGFRLRRVAYEGASYKSHECADSRCTVKMDVEIMIASPVPGLQEWKSKSVLDEQWVKTNGQWWYLPKK
jgi:hypothetical protein